MVWHHTVWPEAELVYTSMAKVANTSIKVALLDSFLPDPTRRGPHNDKIPYLSVEPKRIRAKYPTFCHFAVVRNPFDRLVSFWVDKVENPKRFMPALGDLGLAKGMTFEDTVRIVAATDDSRANGHFRSQAHLLTTRHGELRPDLVLRFERLAEDWDLLRWVVNERNGARMEPLPRRRVSERLHFSEYYDDELWEITARRYATDLALLRYPAARNPAPIAGDPEVEQRLAETLAARPGAGVLDLTRPNIAVISLVESHGGHYLGAGRKSPHSHLVKLEALEHGRIPEAAFDVVIVPRSGGRSPQQRLAERFAVSGRTVIKSGEPAREDARTPVEQAAEPFGRFRRQVSGVLAGGRRRAVKLLRSR